MLAGEGYVQWKDFVQYVRLQRIAPRRRKNMSAWMSLQVAKPKHTSHATPCSVICGLFSPETPCKDDEKLESDSCPQSTRQTNLAMRPDATNHRPDK